MSFILQVPEQYPLVLAVATSTFFLSTFHSFRASKFRKASGIKYPTTYASDELAAKDPKAYMFNCAQRAHANYTESLTPLVGSLLIAGLRQPVVAAALGGLWVVGRIFYLFGYTSSAGPKGRSGGAAPAFLADISLKILAAWTSAMFILGK